MPHFSQFVWSRKHLVFVCWDMNEICSQLEWVVNIPKKQMIGQNRSVHSLK